MCYGCHFVSPVCDDDLPGMVVAVPDSPEDSGEDEAEEDAEEEDDDVTVDYQDVVQMAIDDGHALPSDPAAAHRVALRLLFGDDE